MTTEIRTFHIPDIDPEPSREALGAFLRTVEVERIDTAYSNGAWRILVLYQDLRRKEESLQIEAAIVAELTTWRDRIADAEGVPRHSVLPDDLLPEIARFAPTTERELAVLLGAAGVEMGQHGNDIIHVIRNTLDDLIG